MGVRGRLSNGVGEAKEQAVCFAQHHTSSDAFKTLFREGMTLVEAAAGYLDGEGRVDSKTLRRPAALAYATESMRLTTRLMQVASWLLLRRAVNEGELTAAQAQTERHRVKLARQEMSCDAEMLAELPPAFVELAERSLRLQSRVMHLDRSLVEARLGIAAVAPHPLASHLARVEAAFRSA